MPRNGKSAVTASRAQPKPKPGRLQRTATTSVPVAKALRIRNPGPRYAKASTPSGVRIRHREFIWDITATNPFEFDEFDVNPGITATFPWLAAIASRFESYRFHSLKFIYEPAVSTSASGAVMMAIDYDASDAGPANKTTLMSYKDAARAAPWDHCEFVASSDDLHKLKTHYVRSGVVPNTDIKTYDVGKLYVATQGQDATWNNLVGELYVEYDVELLTPQLNNYAPSLDLVNAGEDVISDTFFGTATAVADPAAAHNGIVSTIDYTILDAGRLRFEQAGTYLLDIIASTTGFVVFDNFLQQGIGFVKQVSSLIGPTAATSFANYVFKANRGDILRIFGTMSGSATNVRMRMTRCAAVAA